MPRLPALIALLIVAGSAGAHHSQVGLFDTDKTIEITGVVKRVSWRNPHGQILLDVTDDKGDVTEWDAETASISVLRNRGFEVANVVDIGDVVTIAGMPSTRNRPQILATSMLLPTDYEFTFGGRQVYFPAGKAGRIFGEQVVLENIEEAIANSSGIFRVWSTNMLDPAQFPIFKGGYPLTAAGQAGWDAFNPAENVLLKCGTKGQPLIMITPLPIEFVDQGDTILMRIEEYDSQRLIHMTAAAQPPAENSLMGFSQGHFEGRDLVVATTHIAAGYFDHNGVPMSDQIKTVERFMPAEDYSRLDYSLTTTDPINFTEPFTLTRHFEWHPGDYVHPYECLDRF